MISVLCAKKDSVYKTIPGVDVWDMERDAYFFTGSNPVITHAPCAQWSKMKGFANDNPDEKELAYFCLNKIMRNGGIFEHPAGSEFFKQAGVTKIYSVDQSWWGFPARKRTYLFFNKCKPLPFPIFTAEPVYTFFGPNQKHSGKKELSKAKRSTTVLSFANWMIDSINKTL